MFTAPLGPIDGHLKAAESQVDPAVACIRGARFVDVSMIAWAFASSRFASPALLEEVGWAVCPCCEALRAKKALERLSHDIV